MKTPANELLSGLIGLVIGWLFGLVISIPLLRIPVVGGVYAPIVFGLILGGYLGLVVGLRKREDFLHVFVRSQGQVRRNGGAEASAKILDTSVIIDGRISDITRSGFFWKGGI